jgi:hypothetical protein
LRNHPNVRFAASTQKPNDEDGGPDKNTALAAIRFAQLHRLPLLADDRVSQSVVLNDDKSNATAAFGTDSVVLALVEAKELTPLEAAHLFLRLIEWRYRFLLVPPALMKALADQYRSHPPGVGMRQLATYVHDCMRDPGLFGGLEPTTPPISIAVRLYQSWIHNISELVMDLWTDDSIGDATAEEFTAWAMSEFLPSPPRTADERMQASVASLTPLTVLSRALIRGSGSKNFKRVNRGLRAIARALGINESQYVAYVAQVAHGVD